MISYREYKPKLSQFKMNDVFWNYYQNLIVDSVLERQEKILGDEMPDVEKSHAFHNLKIAAGKEEGEFYGMVFQDSDIAKWLEAVSNAISITGDAKYLEKANRIIDLIAEAQEPDGYFDTYFQIKCPEKKWKNLCECHELYCFGHMIEAAVSHFESTHERKFLDIAVKMADCVYNVFGPGGRKGVPGHEEIEIGLLKLYEVTSDERYLNLAKHFIDERGRTPNFFEAERNENKWDFWPIDPLNTKYAQNDVPVREIKEAVGHSVRAMYLYTAMAFLAAETNDKELYAACVRVWNNVEGKKLYITGSIGSNVEGESFYKDYDLPNDTNYSETCASVGLIFFARQMLQINPSGKYADVMERALYNTVISGMERDGSKFFYVNPLETIPGLSGDKFGYKHVLPERPGWYACACCPPNIARLLTSLAKYAWGESKDTVYSHIFIGGTYTSRLIDGVKIDVSTEYPWNGYTNYTIDNSGKLFNIRIHIPSWCNNTSIFINGEETSFSIEDGYIHIDQIQKGTTEIKISFGMPVKQYYANNKVRDDAGKVAIGRGPFIYCAEEVDNGCQLYNNIIKSTLNYRLKEENNDVLGKYNSITVDAYKLVNEESQLYTEKSPILELRTLKLIPYFLWGNRGLGEMSVWQKFENNVKR